MQPEKQFRVKIIGILDRKCTYEKMPKNWAGPPPSRYYYGGYDVGGYIVGDVMLDDIGEVVSPIAGLSIISVSWSEHQLCNG